MAKVSNNADLKLFSIIYRSDCQSRVVWLPALPPHHPPTWHYLLPERAGEQPKIPAGDQ